MSRLYGSKTAYLSSTDQWSQNMCENAQNVQVHIYDCMYEHEKAEKPIHDKAAMSLRGKWALIHIGFSLQSLIFGSVDKDLIF